MALGLATQTASGDFAEIIKYDARAGRFFRIDRAQDDYGQWETKNVEITDKFAAIFDLETIEVGWALFANGVAPSFVMAPLGQSFPEKPGDNFKQGFRMRVQLGAPSAGGSEAVREFASCAKAVINSVDALHTAYTAEKAKHPGQLPVVMMKGSTAVVSSGKGQSSTNYAPNLEIVKWVPRPAELPGPDKAHASLPKTAPAANLSDEFDDEIPF